MKPNWGTYYSKYIKLHSDASQTVTWDNFKMLKLKWPETIILESAHHLIVYGIKMGNSIPTSPFFKTNKNEFKKSDQFICIEGRQCKKFPRKEYTSTYINVKQQQNPPLKVFLQWLLIIAMYINTSPFTVTHFVIWTFNCWSRVDIRLIAVPANIMSKPVTAIHACNSHFCPRNSKVISKNMSKYVTRIQQLLWYNHNRTAEQSLT